MIDIIIPIYNARDTLEKTLISINLQSIRDKLTIYLIDDASTCEYTDIINKFKELKIIYKKLDKNSGPGVARQKGLDISTSKFVIFVDSDDLFYDTDSIEKIYTLACMGYDYVIGVTYDEKRNINILNEGDLHGKIYRRAFLEENNIKFNNTRYHEDNYFNNLVLVCNPEKKELKEYVYIYVNNPKSITNIDDNSFGRIEILLFNIKELLIESKKRNCRRDLVIPLITTKIKYINKIYNNFTLSQKELFKSWLIKYNLDLEKYLEKEYDYVVKDMTNNFKY